MNSSAPATCAARVTSASVASGVPYAMLARTVSENRKRVLEHDADLVADGVEGDVAHVGTVDADAAGLHVVEARGAGG